MRRGQVGHFPLESEVGFWKTDTSLCKVRIFTKVSCPRSLLEVPGQEKKVKPPCPLFPQCRWIGKKLQNSLSRLWLVWFRGAYWLSILSLPGAAIAFLFLSFCVKNLCQVFHLTGHTSCWFLGVQAANHQAGGLWEHSWTDMWVATHLQLTSTASSQGDYLGLPFFWLPLRVVWHLQRATFFAPSLKMPLHLWVTHKSLMDSVFFLFPSFFLFLFFTFLHLFSLFLFVMPDT